MNSLTPADALRELIDAVDNQVQRDGITPMPQSRAVRQALIRAKESLLAHPDCGSIIDILRGFADGR